MSLVGVVDVVEESYARPDGSSQDNPTRRRRPHDEAKMRRPDLHHAVAAPVTLESTTSVYPARLRRTSVPSLRPPPPSANGVAPDRPRRFSLGSEGTRRPSPYLQQPNFIYQNQPVSVITPAEASRSSTHLCDRPEGAHYRFMFKP